MKLWRSMKSRFVLFAALLLFVITTAGWFFTGYLTELAARTVKKNVADANLIISLHLINELKRIEGAAAAVAGSPLTLPVLQARTPENIAKANNILDRYHQSLEAAACYLIDRSGITITSSNRNEKDSFVGQNYTFRPYFREAVKGGRGRYFAFGTVSKKRGFFAAAPVKDKEGRIVGVVAIKKELDDIETKLNQYLWFLADRNGIIFLSSLPEARLKSLWPLEEATRKEIAASKQFGPGPFDPVMAKKITAGTETAFKGKRYLAAQQQTPYDGI
ncbi:MAG TPA: cache domain-containing protein, partial [Syntrophales bacterium]|nr:cache domain-containing protein [Syntrophales bacterium]